MILDDLGDVISSGGTTSDGTEIFLSRMPDSPDNAIALYESGGIAGIHAMHPNPGNVIIEQPRIQIQTRAATYQTARSKADEVFKLLDGLRNRDINGVRYHWIEAVQPPFALDIDPGERKIVAVNFEVKKAPS